MTYIHENIKHLRSANKISQDSFASLFDVTRGMIASYEGEVSMPPIELIVRICDHFKIGISDFIRTDLSMAKKYHKSGNKSIVAEPAQKELTNNEKINRLESELRLQREIIESQKITISNLQDSNTLLKELLDIKTQLTKKTE